MQGCQMQFQRLKVEDALSYLDQVKYKFGNQPQVYNDFLDIMKEFNSQSIGTKGVIQQVSNLFRGHPELILGFNTFLPPGYRIEVQPNEQVQVSIPGSNVGGTGPTSLTIHPTCPPTTTQLPVQPVVYQPNLAVNHTPTQHSTSPGAVVSKAHVTHMQGRQRLKVEEALSYLDQVRYKFGDQPQVYDDFLDIMKEFKYQSNDTKSVIQRVSNLFRGHPELILGFNMFLPLGYRIEVPPKEQVQVSIPGSNVGGTVPTSLTVYPTGPPTTTQLPHQPSPAVNHTPTQHSTSPGAAVPKVKVER